MGVDAYVECKKIPAGLYGSEIQLLYNTLCSITKYFESLAGTFTYTRIPIHKNAVRCFLADTREMGIDMCNGIRMMSRGNVAGGDFGRKRERDRMPTLVRKKKNGI